MLKGEYRGGPGLRNGPPRPVHIATKRVPFLASDRIFESVESESVVRVEFNPQTLQTLHSPSKLTYVYTDSL